MAKQQHGNGSAMDNIPDFLAAIAAQDDELDTLKSSYMASCKGPRSRIRDVLDQVREAELSMPAFRVLLNEDRAERRIAKRVAELEADDAESFEAMHAALGALAETPLGAAALKGRKQRGDKTLDELSH